MRSGGSLSNDIGRKCASRTTRADIVASFDRLLMIFLELVQQSVGNFAQLTVLGGILDCCAPGVGRPAVCGAAFRRRDAYRLPCGFRSLTAQPRQFRTPALRVRVIAASEKDDHREGWRAFPRHRHFSRSVRRPAPPSSIRTRKCRRFQCRWTHKGVVWDSKHRVGPRCCPGILPLPRTARYDRA
jgi:hypothetical protein